MAFPLSYSGTFQVDSSRLNLSADTLRERLAESIFQEHGLRAERQGEQVFFRGSLLRGHRGNPLRLVGMGRIQIQTHRERTRVLWHIGYGPLLLLSALFLIVPALLLYTEPAIPPLPKVGILQLLWLWMVGLHYILSSLRFRDFLRREVLASMTVAGRT